MPIFALLLISINLFAHQQVILVVNDDFNSSKAKLTSYEKYNDHYRAVDISFDVQLGKNGLGWGLGLEKFDHLDSDPIKKEGDGKAPAGIFSLVNSFSYETYQNKMHNRRSTKEDICVDDTDSPFYNQIIKRDSTQNIKSFENMRRKDNLYKYGLVVQHNSLGISEAGSCIFMHIWRDKDSATAGCTAMSEENILRLLKWLDSDKYPLLIQIPHSYCSVIEKNYPGLVCREKAF